MYSAALLETVSELITDRRVVAHELCKPTNKSRAPHGQASARTQRMTQDKQWDGGRCRSHRRVPAHVSRGHEGTCGHAIRRSWCLENPSGRPPAFPWSRDPGDSWVHRAPG